MSEPTSPQEAQGAQDVQPEPKPEPEQAAAQHGRDAVAEGSGVPPPGGHHLTPPPRRKWPWVVAVVALLIVGAIVALAVTANDRATKAVTVRYAVTGSAHSVNIAYSTYTNQVIAQNKVTAATLPWSKTISTDGFTHGGALTVTLGASGGTASCTVVADGKTYTATASGPHSAAQCRGF